LSIRVDRVSKNFGVFAALHGVSLEARPGEFLALLGPSGSGKTTLLRIMAGLEFPETGAVYFGGKDVTRLRVQDRHVGFVFQHYALFRHMTVAQNVAFGLCVRPRRARPGRPEIGARVQKLLDLVQLGHLGDRLPSQLSGGQRQRVALARALAVDPKLLLLDEPFGALDAKVRKDLRRWLRALHDQMGITSVFVTHDQEEALELADRVVVMNQGRIEQIGTPREVYEEPSSAFVFDFVGDSNRIPLTIRGGRAELGGHVVDLQPMPRFEGAAELYFRPQDTSICAEPIGKLPVIVHDVRQRGGHVRLEGIIVGTQIPVEAVVAGQRVPEIGETVSIAPTRTSVFQADGGAG
jgi:sulfate transport system ATP-binding protein